MKVLLLGSGGRESALAWALACSRSVDEITAAPGNPGIEDVATLADIDPSDPQVVQNLAAKLEVDLVVVGPEGPLVAGVGDALRAAGINVFGPDRAAALIEGSKAHAKGLMEQAGIPTAAAGVFTSPAEAVEFMDRLGPPYVVKADGLAAGKGVVVTEDRAEAVRAVEDRLVHGAFGGAGSKILIEEFLDGEEASMIAFADGERALVCEPAQDYKRAEDEDRGPNTGGMGSYSPVPACPPELALQIASDVNEPMMRATAGRGAPFMGALYAGLALTSRGPRVIEFNARFGDPETQALLPRLRSDFGELCLACATGSLHDMALDWTDDACVSLVLASGGYPGPYKSGVPISGLQQAAALDGVQVFHAGTRRGPEGLETAGGRVMSVSATGPTFVAARDRAYEAADLIEFEGKHVRRDIAARATDGAA